MIRKLVFFTGVALLALTSVGGTAHADAPNNSKPFWMRDDSALFFQLQKPAKQIDLKVSNSTPLPKTEPPSTTPPAPVQYTVLEGDNLTRIAEAHSTTWLRLWNKNAELTNPDLIFPGQVFLIPDANEQLADRPVPAAVVQALAPAAAVAHGSVSGNTYDSGYCTWYVKNRRPDLPNNLGNANTWYYRAQAQGYPVGSVPRAGAVGTTTAGDLGHVVYVERVNGDGTILISEMNYAGLYSQRTRTAAAGDFLYIY